jgi:myo-inositol-1(or 4)-monophosphatase
MTVMVDSVMKAARSLRRDFGEVENLQVSRKGAHDFVTAADHKSEKILHEALLKARPDFGFVMEESGIVIGKDASHRWHIDPLDGTANFLHGIPHFAISVGLERDGALVAGVVYDPIKDELFIAEKGKGNVIFFDGSTSGMERQLKEILAFGNLSQFENKIKDNE